MSKTYISLSDALYDTFKDVVGTEEEFKKFDAMEEKYWKDAWRDFDIRTWYENK
jgi:hypothetical protein